MAVDVCVIGKDSTIGSALLNRLEKSGFSVTGSTRRDVKADEFHIDLANPESIRIPECKTLVLAAAATNLNFCRANKDIAWQINVESQVKLAALARKQGSFVVFLSTNQVFDGSEPLREPGSPTSPLSLYGRMKAAAELEISSGATKQVAIVRLTKVVSPHIPVFKDWKEKLLESKVIHPYSDLYFSPVSLATAVQGIEAICVNRLNGAWHISGKSDLSYRDAAFFFAGLYGKDKTLVGDGSAAASGIPAEERPRFTALNATDFQKKTGVVIGDAYAELNSGWTNAPAGSV